MGHSGEVILPGPSVTPDTMFGKMEEVTTVYADDIQNDQLTVFCPWRPPHRWPTLTVFPAGINPLCQFWDLADIDVTQARGNT